MAECALLAAVVSSLITSNFPICQPLTFQNQARQYVVDTSGTPARELITELHSVACQCTATAPPLPWVRRIETRSTTHRQPKSSHFLDDAETLDNVIVSGAVSAGKATRLERIAHAREGTD